MPVEATSVPDFDDLPKVDGMPQGCAWGVFDHDGAKDRLGTLNFLTPSVKKAAAAEVKDGVSISLNWPLNALSKMGLPGRKAVKHNILYIPESMAHIGVPEHASSWDDELELNTQSSSQWDSLCHMQHLPSGLSYNGSKPDKQNLTADTTAENDLPTLDHWHERGGIVGRGVLLDYKLYAEENGISFHPMAGNRITVDDLEACARYLKVEFRPADVLLVRTGCTEVLDDASLEGPPQQSAGAMSGLHGSEDTARWLWNKRFAAVASDSFALEAYPPLKPDGTPGDMASLVLHPYMLSLFGMPIGELWDLKRLSQYCKEANRYSFMITSIPLHHPCLIGSPPNAIAIF